MPLGRGWGGAWPVGCRGGVPGLTPSLALLHNSRIRTPFVVLELEEAVQLLQVRDVPLQGLHLRLVLDHLLVRPLPQHVHLGLCLLPGGGQQAQGDPRSHWGQPGVSGVGGVNLGFPGIVGPVWGRGWMDRVNLGSQGWGYHEITKRRKLSGC